MSPLAGTWRVVGAHLRTGWRSLTLSAGAMAGLVVAMAAGVFALYPTPESRAAYAASMGASPATMAFNGQWPDLASPGGITTYEVGFIGLLAFPPIALHLAISRTRAEEDSGRAELLTAGRLGRLAPLSGALIALTLTLVVFATAAAVGLIAVGLPVRGTLWYAGSLGLFAWWFAALGLLAAQLARTARTAMGLGLAAALGIFLVRAVIDGRGIDAQWLTPMGWLPLARPFGPEPTALPLLAFAVTGLALIGLAALLAGRRDLGAGALAPRPGPATGSPLLGHPFGVAARLTRGAALGWGIGLLAWGAALGTLTADMADLVRTNPDLAQLLGGGRPEDIVTSLALVVIALGGGALGLQALGTLQAEEASGRLGLLFGAPIVRARLWTAWWFVIALQMALAMGVGAVGLGISTRLVIDRPSALADAVTGVASYLPAMLALVAVTALAAMIVRGGAALGWVLLAWTAVVALLAETLRLPQWARQVSVLEHVGRVPIEAAEPLALAALAAGAVCALAVATAVGRVRDLRAG
ncbi:MAG: hypothetical protein Q4F67_07810 [Propionibacteriaceae bacterium]|nr:hypothetical protein [Propionibacteriaceae bacterium]